MTVTVTGGLAGPPGQAPWSVPAIRSVVRRYYTVWWVYSFAGGFLFATYPLFLRARGLDQLQMNSVMAVYFVTILLTDVPTGAFADAIGRRRSFLLGCALRVAGFITYLLVHRYVLFLVAEAIDGLGTTFCSGAIDAWGVDALDQLGYGTAKNRLFSRISQLMNAGFMASALLGAYAGQVDLAWPWILGAAGYAVSAGAGALLMREDRVGRMEFRAREIPARIAQRIGGGFRRGFGRRSILFLSLANAAAFAAWSPYWLEWPQLFHESYKAGIGVLGWIYCLLTIAHLLGSQFVAQMGRRPARGRKLALVALVALCAVTLAAAGSLATRPTLALAMLFVMKVATGAMQPLAAAWLNEEIPAQERATLLSFNSTFAMLGGSAGLLGTGYFADRYGIGRAWELLGLVLLLAAPCYWRAETVPREQAMLARPEGATSA